MTINLGEKQRIEITPEMIDRGRFYLASLDLDYFGYSSDSLVEAIIRVAFGMPLSDPDQIALASAAEGLRSTYRRDHSHATRPVHDSATRSSPSPDADPV